MFLIKRFHFVKVNQTVSNKMKQVPCQYKVLVAVNKDYMYTHKACWYLWLCYIYTEGLKAVFFFIILLRPLAYKHIKHRTRFFNAALSCSRSI